jgi:MFS transporter, DHA1 family, inner membrane transport protein
MDGRPRSELTSPSPELAAEAAQRPDGEPSPELPRAARVAALVALGGAVFVFVTGETLPVALLPQLSAGLGVSLSAVGLLVTIYAVVVVAVSAPLTHLTRRVRRRPLLCGLLAIFVLATLAAALAPGYAWLVGARLITALAQAVFWSIVAVVTVSLVPSRLRGRAVAAVFAGAAIAGIVGIPVGTWLGQQAGWRLAFVVLAGLGVLDLVALALLLPPARAGDVHGNVGTNPDARRYRLTVIATALAVAGYFTAYTYVTAFLTRVSGLPLAAIAPVLLFVGIAGAAAIAVTGVLLDRHPVLARVGPLVLLAVALGAYFAFGTVGVAAALLLACASFGISGLDISLQSHVLVVAPRRTDIASAWFSASFNVGIAGGPLVGGLVLSTAGLRFTPLVGAGLVFLGLVAMVMETRLPGRAAAARVPASRV